MQLAMSDFERAKTGQPFAIWSGSRAMLKAPSWSPLRYTICGR
jgi:hypothetical protein